MRWTGWLLGLCMSAVATGAQAQALYTVTYVEAAPASTRQVHNLLKSYIAAGRKDAGNVSLELVKGIHRPTWFAVIGAWQDQKAFDGHAAATHSKDLNEKIKSLVAAPNDTRQHNALSVEAMRPGKAAACAVTHVDVIPPQRESGTAAVKQLAEDSRKHAGNLRFDVLVQTNRPNHFTVVECWKDRKSFNAHVGEAQTKDFRTKLVSMTGALYDERLYKPVD